MKVISTRQQVSEGSSQGNSEKDNDGEQANTQHSQVIVAL